VDSPTFGRRLAARDVFKCTVRGCTDHADVNAAKVRRYLRDSQAPEPPRRPAGGGSLWRDRPRGSRTSKTSGKARANTGPETIREA